MQKILLLLTALTGLAILEQAQWKSKYLDNAEQLQAVCSDGSSPLYFKSLSTTGSKQWVFYLLGGAGCSNQAMCLDRLKNKRYFTSSKGFTGTFQGSRGVFERDCSLNPHFCQYNYVFLNFCSSDWWTGDNTYHFKNSKDPALIHFRGLNIALSILSELLQETPLTQAETFILSGTSAGGVGAMNLADRIHTILKSKVKTLTNFKTVIDSALFLGNPVFKPLPCTDTFYCGVERTFREGYKIWKNHFDQDCAEELKKEAWRCNMVDPGVGFIDAPAMILAYRHDFWQWMSDGGRRQPEAILHLAGKGAEIIQIAKRLLEEKKVEYAVVSSCFFHTFMHFQEEFLQYEIEGKKVADAVQEFVQGETQGRLINECVGQFGCNETCTPTKNFLAKDLSSAPTYNAKINSQ